MDLFKGRARAGCISCGIAILPCPRRPPRYVWLSSVDRRDSESFDRVSPDVGRLSPEVIVTRESLGGGHDDTAPAMTPVLFRDARGQRLQLASASEGRKTLGLFVFSQSASLIFHIFSSCSPFSHDRFARVPTGRQAGPIKSRGKKTRGVGRGNTFAPFKPALSLRLIARLGARWSRLRGQIQLLTMRKRP